METEEERRARLQNDAATKQLRLAQEAEDEKVQKMEWIGFGFDLDIIWIETGVFKKMFKYYCHAMGTIFLVQLYSKEEIILRLGGRFYHLIII